MVRKYNSSAKSSNENPQEITVESEPDGTRSGPMTENEKSKRKRKMKEVLLEQHKDKISRQKKKRLDKYIEHQLKREEKELLLRKLGETRIDSSILKSAKLIGTGSQKTRRELFLDALEKEKQGKGNEETASILYEERTVAKWDDEDKEEPKPTQKSSTETDTQFKQPQSYIPISQDSSGFQFGFSNIKKVQKRAKPSGYSWKTKLELDAKESDRAENDADFLSSEESSVEEDNISESEQQNGEDNEELEGFSGSSDGAATDEEEEEEEEEEETTKLSHSKKAQNFKNWAEGQVRQLEGRSETIIQTAPQFDYTPIVREEDLDDGLEHNFIPINEQLRRKIATVHIDRDDDIQVARMKLPVVGEEHTILEAIHHNDCVIICGETGSGKTTQIPQFLFESGYGSPNSETPGIIGVTQPRRVAAVAMAERVGQELGNCRNKVGYQIRFDANVSEGTAIKFMTDGVLLREMMTDFLLTKYSALIIDEAHERNINTDILIGMLSRVLKLRREKAETDAQNYRPLKLVVMSATLSVSDFSENSRLFRTPPPIVSVPARQYPVSIHFNRRTVPNYNEEAFRKTCKIHSKLPPGGILVFLTGKSEINEMVKRLRKRYPLAKKKLYNDIPEVRTDPRNVEVETEEIEFGVSESTDTFEENDDFTEQDEDEEEEGFEENLEDGQTPEDPLYVLPLYSLLPTKEQMKIFEKPPQGARLCVVATNIAETSLTIPNIRYVVDCGRSKERKYSENTGVQSFEIGWISKASADQRAGRAGRTGPGHCYRLFSSAVYESEFSTFSIPEIQRMPVESVVLTMKAMGIDNIVNFPFVTPPKKEMIRKAETLLRNLGALDDKKNITKLGQKMNSFPLSPRFSKMLVVGNQQGCLPYIIALVSGLSVGDPFISEFEIVPKKDPEEQEEQKDYITEEQRNVLSKFNKSRAVFSKLDKFSDVLQLLSAICAQDHVAKADRMKFYDNNFLRSKIMEDILKLRKQLTYIVKINKGKGLVASASTVSDDELKLELPSKPQIMAIKQMVAAGFIDQIAIRADLIDRDVKLSNNMTISSIPYVTLLPTHEPDTEPNAFIHPASILCKSGELPPSYLIYESLNVNTSSETKKLRMKPLNDISGRSLANVAANSGLITYSKPLGHPYAPRELSPDQRECYVIPRIGANVGTGGVGWDLPAVKVVQQKRAGNWVTK
ncbi:hypothetical protein OGAPHI_002306 [Ogataea philodendri]|uniref:RNA helicase n=2 Tax=Saccharomycotina TaxID=147537 RepID=A0A9P8PAR9_9ASCO|nr:uncharacterized protein OGAPHI_002306 [Ogataea philodendri]KAH3668552.1 hypothetical protein OGAPHI_002306 [Ogataea philodendri]